MNRIRILATSDVHGYVFPYSYVDGKIINGSYSRLKTLINSLRDENTIVLDNGDVLEGSPLSFYHFLKKSDKISPMTIAMNEIGYDYVNVGNHDFNYGEDALFNHLNHLNSKCITTNWYYNDQPFCNTYILKEINGINIALFGLTTQYIPHWEQPKNIQNSKFSSAVDQAKNIVDKIKKDGKADYIICLYHGGFERNLETGQPSEDLTGENEAFEIAKKIPEINVLISGHQHRSLQGKLFKTYYTQTNCNGLELACIDIYPDTNVIETKIIPVEQSFDQHLLNLVKEEEDECQTWLDTPLGHSNIDLSIKDEVDARIHKAQLLTFINKAAIEYSGADISASSLFINATGLNSEITMRNLVSTYVYPNTLVIKQFTGKRLKEYLEKNAEFFSVSEKNQIVIDSSYLYPKNQVYNYDMLDGIEYTIKVSNPIGARIISLTKNGKQIHEDDLFTVVMNNYRASGGGNFDMIKEAKTVKEIATNMVDILADYIMKYKVIDFKPEHNIDVII